jgi:glycosidase
MPSRLNWLWASSAGSSSRWQAAVRFWLERGVDGFRPDVAHYKDPQLRDNPPNPDLAATRFKPMGDYERSFTCTTRYCD